jgi:sodium transport system permease protein
MKNIIIIIKKEIKDLLRDRRTLMTMIIIPIMVFPIIFSIMGKVTSNQIKKETEKSLTIGFNDNGNANQLRQLFENRPDIKIIKYPKLVKFDTLIQSGKLDGAIMISDNFDSNIGTMRTGQIAMLYKSANWGVKERLMGVMDKYKNTMMDERLAKLSIQRPAIDPVEIKVQDVSSQREKLGKTIGGYIPYIFIIFGFMGCVFPAIDLFTNEKEKGTLETLLVTPVKRIEILFGKMTVVSVIGSISAVLSIIGFSFGLKQFANSLPKDVLGSLLNFIEPGNIAMLVVMLVPLIVFFAGILTLITTYAKSYKEAQSFVSPMSFIVIVPAVIGTIPGVELNVKTALIPIVNISLAAKDIIAGTINYSLYGMVLASLLLYACIAVLVAVKWFSKETNIIKS